jgi:hypothetical protein
LFFWFLPRSYNITYVKQPLCQRACGLLQDSFLSNSKKSIL